MSGVQTERGPTRVAPAFESRPQRKPRMDAGTVKATPRDLEMLKFVGEQLAVSMAQLQTLMGVRNDRTVRRVRDRWRRAGWIESRGLVVGGPTMVWLTHRGQRAAGLDYQLWDPTPGTVRHILAVNEVRLLLARRLPEAWWVCERDLARVDYKGKAPHRPDALVTQDGDKIAIEVELTQKSRRRLHEIIRDLLRRYDGVWYFVAPQAHAAVERVAADLGDDRLSIQTMPKELC